MSNAISKKWETFGAILDLQLPQTDKLVMLGILRHTDESFGNSFPGNVTLGRYASVTREQTITDAVKRLKKTGLIANRHENGMRRIFRVDLMALTEAITSVREQLRGPDKPCALGVEKPTLNVAKPTLGVDDHARLALKNQHQALVEEEKNQHQALDGPNDRRWQPSTVDVDITGNLTGKTNQDSLTGEAPSAPTVAAIPTAGEDSAEEATPEVRAWISPNPGKTGVHARGVTVRLPGRKAETITLGVLKGHRPHESDDDLIAFAETEAHAWACNPDRAYNGKPVTLVGKIVSGLRHRFADWKTNRAAPPPVKQPNLPFADMLPGESVAAAIRRKQIAKGIYGGRP